jgi:SAM-dependent methyltransferase
MSALNEWKIRMAIMESPVILLCGAKVWEGSVNPNNTLHAPNGRWATTDIFEGDGVDIVMDLQYVDQQKPECIGYFDGIFCPSVLEHVPRPWLAVKSMADMLKPNGSIFIQTHQTFPLHGYPHDYFRFSTEALQIMCEDAGLTVRASGYDFPCTITPPTENTVWNTIAESYLNVVICASKI